MELKDFLEITGIKIPEGKELKDVSLDDAKAQFGKSFIGRKVAAADPDIKNQIIGKEKGALAVNLKRDYEKLGIKFEDGECKEGDRLMLDKVIEAGNKKLDEHIKTIQESANQNNDDKLKKVIEEKEKLQTDYQTILGERDTLKSTVSEKEKAFEEYKSGHDKTNRIEKAWDSVKFSEEASELEVIGFRTEFSKKYEVELSTEGDSSDGLRVIDKKTKQRVVDGNDFIPLVKIIENDAKNAKILKLNDNSTEKKKYTPPKDSKGNEVEINPRAAQIAQGE